MRQHLVSLLACCSAAVVLAVAALFGVAGCQKPVATPEVAQPVGPIPLNSFVRSWQYQVELPASDGIKEIYARERDLFLYTKGGQVIVTDRATGSPRWITQIRTTDRGGMRPPVVLKEQIIIPTSSTLELFEPTEGSLQRSIPLKVAARSDAIGAGNMVYLGGDSAGAGRVVALDITRPYVPTIWQLMIPKGGLQSTPVLWEDVLYIGGGDGNVYAVAAANHEALWPLKDNVFKTQGPIVGDLAVDESSVYVPSTDSRFYALNRNSGKLRWQYHAGVALREGATVTASAVYLPIPDTGIAAFAKGDGAHDRQPMWVANGMAQFLAEDEKLVYMSRAIDNAIVAFDKMTGEQRFENNRRDLVTFATNVISGKSDGTIYAVTRTNRVLAIKPVLRPGISGELAWHDLDAADTAVAGR